MLPASNHSGNRPWSGSVRRRHVVVMIHGRSTWSARTEPRRSDKARRMSSQALQLQAGQLLSAATVMPGHENLWLTDYLCIPTSHLQQTVQGCTAAALANFSSSTTSKRWRASP